MFTTTPIFPLRPEENPPPPFEVISVDDEWGVALPRTAPTESLDITVQVAPPDGAIDVDTSWS